ncbi:NAD-dependent epimerase/dehydratase family protein [Pseudoroseicyclus aestuarii]|uniref:dTDP-4-dehydrorhamnose reductase n=1 Tax=Pseudoroseicyclus aestuarii TaxID=1795041 RepID=A0A318SWM7_9RHOB|nr:sugar nucleotide-binding protein [Pseudoroseicyclus aestuarii]PYE84809.1 dTDP-4-dehydrorhamnose reductase [Pseudoroseicyclus aestuarii]
MSGPLILGAGGRLGRALRQLADSGAWEGGAEALWHGRQGDYAWDMLAEEAPADPRLARCRGVIVLAGRTSGDPQVLAQNAALARAALTLARREGLGPVLLLSTAAVYGGGERAWSEDDVPAPSAAYGESKLEMERAVADAPGACCLRLANVAGSDALFGAMASGPVVLDRFADGTAPQRAYIGPLTLAQTLTRLIAAPALPRVLNLAAPGTAAMDAVLREAGADWSWRPAPETALRAMRLDTGLLQGLLAPPLPEISAKALVTEARAAGWSRAA